MKVNVGVAPAFPSTADWSSIERVGSFSLSRIVPSALMDATPEANSRPTEGLDNVTLYYSVPSNTTSLATTTSIGKLVVPIGNVNVPLFTV